MSMEIGPALGKHNSMRDSMAPEEKEEAQDSPQQKHQQPQRLPYTIAGLSTGGTKEASARTQ